MKDILLGINHMIYLII